MLYVIAQGTDVGAIAGKANEAGKGAYDAQVKNDEQDVELASVLIGYLAANTTTLHLGSGGVMLPNHSPLVIAEQFGTLNTLY
ncbi:LLM class flavin-dependent oxidoreductase, partial [Salmonella enterica subsp. enterica serovar Cerro]|nr:LLM class flavin-dependent oxidoreductase [Salmonella enterica subsp. enterica serovar Cerro]